MADGVLARDDIVLLLRIAVSDPDSRTAALTAVAALPPAARPASRNAAVPGEKLASTVRDRLLASTGFPGQLAALGDLRDVAQVTAPSPPTVLASGQGGSPAGTRLAYLYFGHPRPRVTWSATRGGDHG